MQQSARRLPNETVTTVHVRRRVTGRKTCGVCAKRGGNRTKLMNSVKGWLRTMALTVRAPRRSVSSASKETRERSRGRHSSSVERVLVMVEAVKSRSPVPTRIGKNFRGGPVCVRLMTVPGVGPVTAVAILQLHWTTPVASTAPPAWILLGLVPGETRAPIGGESPRLRKPCAQVR